MDAAKTPETQSEMIKCMVTAFHTYTAQQSWSKSSRFLQNAFKHLVPEENKLQLIMQLSYCVNKQTNNKPDRDSNKGGKQNDVITFLSSQEESDHTCASASEDEDNPESSCSEDPEIDPEDDPSDKPLDDPYYYPKPGSEYWNSKWLRGRKGSRTGLKGITHDGNGEKNKKRYRVSYRDSEREACSRRFYTKKAAADFVYQLYQQQS